jgi:hypothetical protein
VYALIEQDFLIGGSCKEFAPTWEKLAASLKRIKTAHVYIDDEGTLVCCCVGSDCIVLSQMGKKLPVNLVYWMLAFQTFSYIRQQPQQRKSIPIILLCFYSIVLQHLFQPPCWRCEKCKKTKKRDSSACEGPPKRWCWHFFESWTQGAVSPAKVAVCRETAVEGQPQPPNPRHMMHAVQLPFLR